MSYWRDKSVLITGGSAGLGFVLARNFAEQGANVLISARDVARLESAAQQLRSSGQVTPIPADVTRNEDVSNLIQCVVETTGHLDVLVNNVGRSTRNAVLDTTPEQFDELMAVNFLTVVRCTRAAMPHLTQRGGHVVNIGSLSAKTVSPFFSAYAASKFAVAAYTSQLRLEGPPEVHYLLVCPGPIAREDAGQRYDDQAENLPEEARRPGGGAS